jgi:hypothetical protein
MDRLIALLAALVGLIALGGALLVHNAATATMQRQATEIAALQEALKSAPASVPTQLQSSSAPAADTKTADTVAALERRIASLEATTSAQATELAAARATLDAQADIMSSAPAPATEVAEAEQPKSSAAPAALTADGPTTDCIPLGTRFMSQTGDSFPICKTSVVVNVSSVSEGTAIVEGAGPVAAGGFANLPVQGCTVMVFTADAAGFAEMRVSCT